MRTKFRYFIFFIFFVVCYFVLVFVANAHRVHIHAYVENSMVHSESYFSDGTRCKFSLLEVFDEKKKTKLLEGKTDEEGRFSFKIPKITSLKLVLHAGMGHRAEFILSEDEVREARNIKQLRKLPSVKVPQEAVAPMKTQKKPLPEVSELKGISESEIKAIVESVVDKKLEPIRKMLVKLQESITKPTINEIIGAIGYIIGIFGIIAYFKAKRIKKS